MKMSGFCKYKTEEDWEGFVQDYCDHMSSCLPKRAFPGASINSIKKYLSSDKLTDEQKYRCQAAEREGTNEAFKRLLNFVENGGASQAQMTGAIFICKNKGLSDNPVDITSSIKLSGSSVEQLNQVVDARASGELESRQFNDLMRIQEVSVITELQSKMEEQRELISNLLSEKNK